MVILSVSRLVKTGFACPSLLLSAIDDSWCDRKTEVEEKWNLSHSIHSCEIRAFFLFSRLAQSTTTECQRINDAASYSQHFVWCLESFTLYLIFDNHRDLFLVSQGRLFGLWRNLTSSSIAQRELLKLFNVTWRNVTSIYVVNIPNRSPPLRLVVKSKMLAV